MKSARKSNRPLLAGDGGVRGRVISRIELSAHAATKKIFRFKDSKPRYDGPSAFSSAEGNNARCRTPVPRQRSRVCNIAGHGRDGSSSSSSSSNSTLSSNGFPDSPSSSESSEITALVEPFVFWGDEETSCAGLKGRPPLQMTFTPFS